MSFGRTLSMFVSFAALSCVFAFVLSDRAQPPLHALVLFGPEGKLAVQVQLHGDAVWLDKNGDGQFDRDEQFADSDDIKDLELRDPDGRTTYLIKGLGFWKESSSSPPQLDVSVRIQGAANYREYCDVTMRPLSQPPEMAHFHGPLAIGPISVNWQVPPRLALRTGEKATELGAIIGTLDGMKRCWTVVRVHDHEDHWLLPEGAFPVVDVEFPAKNEGAPPIKRRYPLTGFC